MEVVFACIVLSDVVNLISAVWMLRAAVSTPSAVILECIPKVLKDLNRDGSENRVEEGNTSRGKRDCKYCTCGSYSSLGLHRVPISDRNRRLAERVADMPINVIYVIVIF